MATEINVPVKLQIQNLQSLVGELEKKLGNLKVGSSGFKNIQSLINSIRGEIDKLQVQTSKPFIDASQFTKAEHSVERLEDQIEKVGISISRIKFSDLELTSGQKADLKAFEDQINSIKEKLRVVKSTAKDEFLNSAMGQEWLKIDDTAFSKSLSQITNNIRRAVQDQKTELEKLEEVAKSYQKALSENERIKDFTNKMVDDPANGSDLFSKKWQELTKNLSNGKVQFQAGGKNLMVQWLESQLKIDSSVLHSLLSKSVTASNIGQELKKLLNEQLAKNEKVIQSNPNVEANVEALRVKYEGLLNILRQVGVSEQQVAQVEAVLRQELGETSQKTQEYQDNLVNAARANTDVASTSNAMKSELENLRGTLQQTNAQFIQMQRTQQSFNQMKMAVVNFMGFNQVLNLTKNAIRNAINHIQELDSVMNKISIVTDMSTADLWNQVDAYSQMAQAYGVSIKGAYEVSQIYYQQGLQTNDVLTLTNETLKLARISGLDYAQTTDYMTTALRGFKMEMSEASTVVDVYSNLASHTAVSQEELAVAMSKTASSMEGVGATFEEASAMIATMVAVTRESATNIGSAMKSIASRYGELTKDPLKLIDDEGEVMAFNKVDAALQSVGISMKTADGQFREFTDVIIELGEKWNELESVQQRYIATQFAGNRQQSRFLALVSNVDLLKSNLDYAENSEDTGTLQALKALDSIESKIEQVRVAYQQFYTTLGMENAWKGLLDGTKEVINTLNGLPKLFGKIPLGAIAAIANVITLVKGLLTKGIQGIASIWNNALSKTTSEAGSQGQTTGKNYMQSLEAAIRTGTPAVQAAIRTALSLNDNTAGIQMNQRQQELYRVGNGEYVRNYQKLTENYYNNGMMSKELYDNAVATGNYKNAVEQANQAIRENNGLLRSNTQEHAQNNAETEQGTTVKKRWFEVLGDSSSKLSRNLNGVAMGLTTLGLLLNKDTETGRIASGVFTGLGGALQGTIGLTRIMVGNWSALPQLVMGIMNVINGLGIAIETPEEKLERLTKEAEELNNQAKEAKANYRTLDNSIKKLDELKEKRYESAEAAEEYQTAVDELAEKFPAMIAGFDEAGNIILDTTDAERILAEARNKSKEAAYAAAEAELNKAQEQKNQAKSALKEAQGQLEVQLFTDTGDEVHSVERRKYFNTKNYQDVNGINHNVKDLITEGDFIGTLYNASASGTERELTADEVVEGVKEFNEALQKIGNQAYDFINEFTGETAKELYTYMQTYKSQHKVSELTPEFFEIEQLINEELQEQINLAYQSTVQEINKLKDLDVNDQNFDDQIQIVNQAIHAYQNLVGESSVEFTRFDNVIAALGDVNAAMKDYINMNEIYQGNSRAVISAWQQSATANSEAWDVLSKSSFAAALVTEQIVQEIGNGNYEELVKKNSETKKWRTYQEEMAEFISKMNEDTLSVFNQMGNDTANYTAEDIIEQFNIQDDKIKSYIIAHYNNGITSIQERLRQALSQVSGNNYNVETKSFDDIFNDEFYRQFNIITHKQLTTTEEKYLNNILSQYNSIQDNGYAVRAAQFGSSAIDLFNQISEAPANIEKQLWQLINEKGLTTLEGIQQIQDAINNNVALQGYIDKDTLTQFYNNIIPNINLEIQAATSNLLETWEDTSKELSSAMSGGIGLKEADALINKAKSLGLNFNLNDFTVAGDKLILSEEQFSLYYQKLEETAKKTAESWKERITKIDAFANRINNGQYFSYTEDERALLQSFGFDLSKYYINGKLTTEGIIELNKIVAQNRDNLENYNRAAQIAADQLKNSYDRSKGVYKLHTGDTEHLTRKNIESYMDNTDLGWSETDVTIRAIIDEVSQVYDQLMSDVFSKGWEKINLNDYEGLIDSDIADLQVLKNNKDYVGFAHIYGKIAGNTIDEINDLVLQAYEKEHEHFSEDLIKDFTFTDKDTFKAARDSLTNLAKAYDKDVEEIFQKYQDSFDTKTGEYTISVSQLFTDFGIDLSQIDYFNETVQESIDSLFSGLTSDIQKALEGKIDAKGVTQLRETLSALGLGGVELDFTRTTEGIKITEDSFFSLYNNLKKVNSVATKSLIPAMKSQFKSLNNLTDAMEELEKAEKAKNEEKARAIADVVGEYLRESPEAYKMFTKDLPVEIQKAQNIIESTFAARDKVKKAATSGTMEFSDFYGILGDLDPNTMINGRSVQELIDLSYGAYDWKDGKAIVNLRQLGLVAEDYYALSQAILEAGDARRAAGEAYEQMVRTINQGSKIDWTTIIDSTGNVDKQELDKKINENAELRESLEKFKINNLSFVEWLNDESFNQDLLNAFIQRYSKGEFTEAQLSEQLVEMLGLDAENIEIDIDEKSKEVHINYVTENGKIVPAIVVGGKTLTGKDLITYNSLMAEENAQLLAGDNGFSIVFDLKGNRVEAVYDVEDGGYKYNVEGIGEVESLEELRFALAAKAAEETKEIENDNEIKTYSFTLHGIKYEIGVDANGVILGGERTIGGSVENLTNEEIAKIQAELDKQDKQALTKTVQAEGELDSLSLSLAEGAAIELAVETVVLSKHVGEVTGTADKLIINNLIVKELATALSTLALNGTPIASVEAQTALLKITDALLRMYVGEGNLTLPTGVMSGTATGITVESSNVSTDITQLSEPIAQMTGTVSSLIISLSKGENGEAAISNEVEEAWNNFKTTPLSADEKQATVALLKIALGANDKGKNIEETPELRSTLEAYTILPPVSKTVILSGIVLGLAENAIKGDSAANNFENQVRTLLSAVDIPINNVELIIQGFNLINDTLDNTKIDESKKQALETALQTALTAASLTGKVELAQLIITGFSNPEASNLDLSSLLNEDGTLNLDSISDLAAKATISKLQLVVNNITSTDVGTELSENGIELNITGATAKASGLSKVIITDKELTAVDEHGAPITVPITPELADTLGLGSLFNASGEYIGEDKDNYKLEVVAKVLQSLDSESWQKLYDNVYENYKLKTQVEVEDTTDSGKSVLDNFRQEWYANRTNYDWIKEYGGIDDTGAGQHSDFIKENSLLAQQIALYKEAVQLKQTLGSADVQMLTQLKYLGSTWLTLEDLADIDSILTQNTLNKSDLQAQIQNLTALSNIESGNLDTLNNALNNLQATLVLLQGIEIQPLLEKITNIKEAIASDESGDGHLNLFISADDEEIEEIRTSIQAVIDLILADHKLGLSSDVEKVVSDINSALDRLTRITRTIHIDVETDGPAISTGKIIKPSDKNKTESKLAIAKGNIALATGRKTLMGELGPEMYVSHGHYYVAGQGGAEMVDLPEDAIVFNHIQTRSLLKNGKATRGKAVVNERVATGMAHAAGGPDWKKFSSWSDANAAIATALEHISRSASDSNWQEQNKKAAEQWKRDYVKYLADQQEAANKQLQAAELQEANSEGLQETAENLKKVRQTDPNRLHTGYIRANSSSTDEKTASTSVSNGHYVNARYDATNPMSKPFSAYGASYTGSVGGADSKTAEEYAKQVQSVISKLLEVGFEAINLDSSEFEKLDKTLKAEMKQYISQAEASYREFVRMYGEAANLTVSEFNTKYFEAWQKDLGNTGEAQEIRDAAKNLNFFAGGSIGGSAEDWVTLFGDYTAVVDLVNAGIIDWNEDLEQYVVTSIEALQQFDTNLDITKFQDIIADSLRATSKAMTDLISKAESGEITYEEFNKLNAYLDQNQLSQISRDVLTQTANGLVVNYKTLANLYAEAVNKNLDKETLNTLRNIKDTRLTNINNALQSGMGGSMKWEELDNLQSLLDDYDDKTAIKFTQTTEGLKLSTDTLIHFYNLLQQVDGIQAHLTFKRLNDSLKESNTHYKSATTILARIKDLQDAINDAKHYSDEKIRQYQEELSLAEEILAVRATSKDDSFDFINQELPGGLNNPLTYANAWAEGWKEIKQATGEDGSGIIDFKMFYNMANEINNLAKTTGASLNFFGTTLDGGIENLDKLITKAASSLGSSVDGSKFGVSLAKFGGDLTSGMDSYADSADEAMHTMAQAQIKVLDGLIAMFEMIVAMEEFEGADLDMDGILDLDEVFDLTGLTEDMYDTATKFKAEFVEGAKNFVEVMESNEEFAAMANAIRLNGHTLSELIKDAADNGIKDLDISAEMYQQAVSVLFEAFKNGDFNPDDIYNSLKEFLLSNESGYNGTFQLNDIIIDLKYGAEVKVTEAGYEAAGKTYDNENDAFQAAILARQGAKNIEVVEGQATGTLTIGKLDMTVTSVDKNVTYNGQYSTLDDAIKAQYEAAVASGETTLNLPEWKIQQEITVVPVVGVNLKESSLNLDQDQINNLNGVSFEKIKEVWDTVSTTEAGTLDFEATYGIALNDSTTEEDWARFKELAGIETKNIEINASINLVNSNETIERLLNTYGNNNSKEGTDIPIGADPKEANDTADSTIDLISGMSASITIEAVDNASNIISSIQDSLNDLERTYTATIETEDKTDTSTGGESSAKGTVSGTAMAGGTQTLMGELGPELYVSNGRYHLAGQNGAEFVNLPDDAIVFNHLQTQRLLATGSAGRGKPITNERNAVAMARGTEGPAAASAREILATLKQMRAMWESLANMSVRELAGVGETKSGGDKKQVAAWLAQVERWYNLLQKIARLEKEINYQEALRNQLESARVPDGETYYKSQVQSLDNLKQQALTYKELADSQEAYFKLRQTELNSEESPFSKYYTYDDFGQIKFNTNANGESMFNELEAIVHQTDYGETLTPAEQYQKYVQEMGLDQFALRKADGTLINRGDYEDQDEFFRDSVQAVWERMEAEQKEMQDLYNSKEDNKVKYLNQITEANKILQEIVDNQMEVENNVLKALETREQKVIDKMSDERQALADSSAEYIKGLQDALSQERTMYERQQDQNDLTKLQRQLAILQRSGGSASEIANLQQQISEQQKDAYFSAQEQAISSAQDASDLQLEKLQQQIDIMQETLEYQKENGLLWREAIAIMNKTPNEIVEFITANMDDWKSKSVTGQQEEIRKLTSMTQQWVGYRQNLDSDLFDTQQAINEGFEAQVEAAYDPAAIDLSDVIGADINNWRKTPVTYKEDHANTSNVPNANNYAYGYNNQYSNDLMQAYMHGQLDYENLTPEMRRQLENNIRSYGQDFIPTAGIAGSQAAAYNTLSSVMSRTLGTNIDNMSLNMYVSQMSNDYDAEQAGRKVMNTILDAASKSAGSNRVRR